MNVALVTQSFGAGGAEKMMAFVINTLVPVSDRISIILTENVIDYIFPDNVTFKVLKPYDRSNGPLDKVNELRYIAKEANKIIIEESIDLLIGFGAYFATVCVLAAKGTHCKVIGSERRAPSMMTKTWQLISKWSYKKCDMLVFQLKGARDYYSNLKTEQTRIIPNPYISKWDDLPNIDARRKVVCMAAARLEYEKGFDIGIKAMSKVVKKHNDYKMEIYGAGDFESLYGDLIRNLQMQEFVDYKGISKTIIEDIYDVSVFALPSRSEGIPNMLLEAMAAGIPSIAADCPPGGPKMLIENEQNGLIVPTENCDLLADAICSIIENDYLSVKLSRNSRKIKDRFDPFVIGKEWLDCVQTVLVSNNDL